MEGFSERGAPDGWDTAMGKVRGYRMWTMRLCLRSLHGLSLGFRSGMVRGWGSSEDYPAQYMPVFDQSHVEGMYGGHWKDFQMRDGWYLAHCSALSIFTGDSLQNPGHKVPAPGCGCGYWAYWNPENCPEFVSQLAWVRKRNHSGGGYDVNIPLSGAIDGSGATIIGERGFRTERARITDLAIPTLEGSMYEEVADLSFGQFNFPPQFNFSEVFARPAAPLYQLLSEITEVPEHMVAQTILRAVAYNLGNSFKMHDSPQALLKACPPDENYGS